MKINVVLCLNTNNIESLKPIITSILQHTKRTIEFYLISPNKDFEKISNYIRNNNINIKVNYTKIINTQYYPLFIKTIFPNLDKIIYVDYKTLFQDDIGKLYDSIELNNNNLISYSKPYWYQNFFKSNKGFIFITNLNLWSSELYDKIFKYIFNLMSCNQIIDKLFTNCSTDLKLSWNNNKFETKLWDYYSKETNNFIYLLYYDNNPSNGRSKLFLDSVNNLNFNLIPVNVHQFEKELDLNSLELSLGINLKRHFCVKFFIQKNGLEKYYLFTDAYDIYFLDFNCKIIDYIEENNIKILYQNSTLGFRGTSIISPVVLNMCLNSLASSSFGVNGGSFIGKGNNILNFYSRLFQFVKPEDHSDECLMSQLPDLSNYISLDTKYFSFNTENTRVNLKSFGNQELSDIRIFKDLNPYLFIIHFPSGNGKRLMAKLKNYLEDNNKIIDLKYNNNRYYLIKVYFILVPILLTIVKILFIILNYFYIMISYIWKLI